jgi:hypothetical protein
MGNRAPSPSPSRDHAVFIAAVDALAADARERGPIAGLSIAVFEHDEAVLARGYGAADLEAGIAATAITSYPIASVTKTFTAAAVLRLADQGKLSLDDPLSRFFPAARPRIGGLTIRHLLEHTSGLTRGGPAPRAAALSVISRGGTARAQGEDWDYSNYNFSLLGLVIELSFRPNRYFCLPILWRVYEKRGSKAKKKHRTKSQLAAEMVTVLSGWLPERKILVIGDSAYIGKHLLRQRPANVDALGPIHWKAALYEAWAEPKGKRRRLINNILQVQVNLILCFRAEEKIEIVRHGVARRAKLYFLRDRVGKAATLRERRTNG